MKLLNLNLYINMNIFLMKMKYIKNMLILINTNINENIGIMYKVIHKIIKSNISFIIKNKFKLCIFWFKMKKYFKFFLNKNNFFHYK